MNCQLTKQLTANGYCKKTPCMNDSINNEYCITVSHLITAFQSTKPYNLNDSYY